MRTCCLRVAGAIVVLSLVMIQLLPDVGSGSLIRGGFGAQLAAIPAAQAVAPSSSLYSYSAYLPVVLQDAGPSTIITPTISLGSISFTPDTSARQVATYPSDGTGATLTVTDTAGIIWTLAIPGDALLASQAISMTAFATVDSSAAAITVTNGVILEPDGIQFTQPATLTATMPATFTGKAILLLATADGSQLQLAETTVSGGSYSAPIYHFSSSGLAAGSTSDWESQMLAKATQLYNQAYANATAFRKAPAPTPPVPPSQSLLCVNTPAFVSQEKAIDKYMADFAKPYADVITPLLGAARTLALLGADPSTGALDSAGQIVGKGMTVASGQVTQYKNDPDKYTAVVQNTLAVARQYILLTGASDSATMSAIGSWSIKVRDSYLNDKLRTQHEYKAVPALWFLERQAILVGATNSSDGFIDKVAQSMMFNVTIDNTFSLAGAYYFAQHGEGIKTDPYFKAAGGTVNYSAGNYTGFPLNLPLSYPAQTYIPIGRLDPCVAGTLDLVVQSWGASEEVFSTPDGPLTVPGLATSIADAAWYDDGRCDVDRGCMFFTMTIADQNVTAADYTFDHTDPSGFHANSRLQVTHAPQ